MDRAIKEEGRSLKYAMVSYADNFEDVLLNRAFKSITKGFYIDIGAYDPISHSITKHFYDQGWHGINVEPNPAPFARLCASRTRDLNLNLGISEKAGQLTIYEAPNACWSVDEDLLTGWFGAKSSEIQPRSIPVITLEQLCEAHVPEGLTIDFLKVDVEGHERAVIAGGEWSKWRPRVVIIEANRPEHWHSILDEAGYHFVLFDGVNRIYVRDEDKDLIPGLSVPVNVGDQFAIHGYLAAIYGLQEQLDEVNRLGRNTIKLARTMKAMATRHPRIARLARLAYKRLAS